MVINFCRTLWRLKISCKSMFLLEPFHHFVSMLILWTYSGTHISNTREAKAFALLSEEGIAKGIRRITAVTTDVAFKAIELAHSLEQEVDDASKTEGISLEKVGTDFTII